MQVVFSHIECNFPYQDTFIRYLVYACTNELDSRINSAKISMPQKLFEEYKIPAGTLDRLVGYTLIMSEKCDNVSEACINKRVCDEFGNCEQDRKNGNIYRIKFIYVHPNFRRCRIGFSMTLYFKNLVNQYLRPGGVTKYGSALRNFRLAYIQEEKSKWI